MILRPKMKAWHKKTNQWISEIESINLETKVLGVYMPEGYQLLRWSDFEIVNYTGLIDAESNEICESDILKDIEGVKWKVVFTHGAFYAHCLDLNIRKLLSTVNMFSRVIGNVHDNPDLLEVPNE